MMAEKGRKRSGPRKEQLAALGWPAKRALHSTLSDMSSGSAHGRTRHLFYGRVTMADVRKLWRRSSGQASRDRAQPEGLARVTLAILNLYLHLTPHSVRNAFNKRWLAVLFGAVAK